MSFLNFWCPYVCCQCMEMQLISCKFILCPMTWLSPPINSESFVFRDCLWFSIQKRANKSRFVSSFPIYMSISFYLLCYLELLAQYWIQWEYACLPCSWSSRKAFAVFILSIRLAVYQVKKVLFCSYFLRIFIMNMCWILPDPFFFCISWNVIFLL